MKEWEDDEYYDQLPLDVLNRLRVYHRSKDKQIGDAIFRKLLEERSRPTPPVSGPTQGKEETSGGKAV